MDPQAPLLLLLLLPFSLLLLLLLKTNIKRNHQNLPPGPRRLPIIGNLHQLGLSPYHSLHTLSVKHGPLVFLQLGSVPALIVSSSSAAQQIIKSHDAAFSNRPHFQAAYKLTYGGIDITTSPYGNYWKQLRKVCINELLSLKCVESFRTLREDEVSRLIDRIKNSSSSSSTMINLTKVMLNFGNNFVCRIMFGDKFRERESRFDEIISETKGLVEEFWVSDFLPGLKWVNEVRGDKKRLEKNFKEFDGFFDEMIKEHVSVDGDEHEDLLHILLRLQKDPSYSASFTSITNVKSLMLDIFIGGSDSSSEIIVWTMAELMRNVRVMSKLQKEIQQVVGSKSKVEESDLQSLNYLKLVIKETLRLHPPGPFLVPRETIEPCNIEEYDIPSKTMVFINAKALAMDPKSWKNPHEFWPERFLENDRDYKPTQYFDYMPFGFGRRGCPGVNFALAIMDLTLANLLHSFDWEPPFGMKVEDMDFGEVFSLATCMKNNLCLVAKAK
ncbi:uncharacterized protein A4U43_C09F5850 [Asparagus officinalis]|uniref:Cytochrome P450 n=1 Tax=Asparagus officinalis TaxID=4686 RepID=A0A5P1E5M8_ASPOF|nr:cytochrome P450 71A9-like [Asparagus officinalis]ONK57941.1 uncharacterized protein A4U43_C09F5850 [Asparagus officinalis]